jgi:hypothetical protein
VKGEIPGERHARPHFQQCYGNFTFYLFLTECPVPGSVIRRRLLFFGGKSIREYFTDKSGAFHYFFSYVGKYRIIITPTNKDKKWIPFIFYTVFKSGFY